MDGPEGGWRARTPPRPAFLLVETAGWEFAPCGGATITTGTAVVDEGWIWGPGHGVAAPIPAPSRACLKKAESCDSSSAAPSILLVCLTPASGLPTVASREGFQLIWPVELACHNEGGSWRVSIGDSDSEKRW
jgi:hypothetical protein